MISGDLEASESWAIDVGFGPARPLNYLTRLAKTSATTVQVFLPDRQGVVNFTLGGNGDFVMNEGELALPIGSVVSFSVAGDVAILTMSDGRVWSYADASNVTGAPPLPPTIQAVYRITRMTTRQGFHTNIQYNPANITIIDASGNNYVCAFNVNTRRITSIAAANRSWTYEYVDNVPEYTVKETAPDGSWISTTVRRFTKIILPPVTQPDPNLPGGSYSGAACCGEE